jgi:tRNA A-37 threonylcarbamoyl transferase component Bud32
VQGQARESGRAPTQLGRFSPECDDLPFGPSPEARDPAAGLVSLGPRALADWMLACPLRALANVVALRPAPDACSLVLKRGSATLGTFRFAPEVGTAAAVRLAHAAGIDPVSLAADAAGAEAARRVGVRIGPDAGEVLVSVAAVAHGLAVEVRPLLVNGRSPEIPRGGQLRRCVACGALQPSPRSTCELDGSDLVDVVDRPEPGGCIGVYRLGRKLGEGGMGTVIEGEHAFLGRRVAIKLLHRTMDQDPVVGRRFLSEARAASGIRHRGIVEIIDYGLLSDGRPYMVMERLEGESLEERIERGPPLDPVAALLLVHQIARALDAAHEGGIVHLDLKPANVFLVDTFDEGGPHLKLIDFGAATVAGCRAEDGVLVGTPSYMSPEHARGEPADCRSDLYALGVMMFELLSGRLPFEHENSREMLKAHLFEAPPRVTSPLGALPEPVTRLVDRALRKRVDERYQTAGELMAEIDRALVALRRGDWLSWLP